MATIPLEEAQEHLAELVSRLSPGEAVTLTRDDRPVATLMAIQPPPDAAPRLGTLKGTVLSMEHFDAPLEEFEEYSG